jgi:hypothetical protein
MAQTIICISHPTENSRLRYAHLLGGATAQRVPLSRRRGQWSRIAAVDDPLPIRRLSRDDPDMMRPDHHHADSGTACMGAFARPRSREREATVRFAKIFAQVTAAPGVRPMTVMPMVGTRFCLNAVENRIQFDPIHLG